ncbi:hypothetical protein P3T76_013858 [Phytophthora citrophthora]|uniref:Uncharacterized protein n=1 Tax=Phytophthora citrophthora TaxID=4793 RepID=A0AAD9G2G8_9STRA|nr:hypothetical protein P3T76_013858 [Phytophthora citrophthora]
MRTAQNSLVLKCADELLRVVDARKFCAGFVDVRHSLELPSGVTFIKRNSSGGAGIALENTVDEDGEWSGTIYIVDFQTGDVGVRTLPRLNEMAADIFVDEKGEQVAMVGATNSDVHVDSTEGLTLFVTEKWTFMVLVIGKVLYHFQIDQDLTNCPVKRLVLDHHVLDGVWIDQDTAFAILFVNGQISIASVNGVGCFELLEIETSSTMSKHLSLSALLGQAVPAALQPSSLTLSPKSLQQALMMGIENP